MGREQPIVKMKNIADHLGVNRKTAAKLLQGAPFIEKYYPIKAIYPSSLKLFLEENKEN